ncbi:glycosyltransferase [Psychroserpens burtonensis]|uniref:Glycosyltransferase n=1 Tax=Psychroserpens burtonensis TaxID=49278 RepID=A0A5C7BBR2_9FLAO|nr:glycosyltransferase [Psychroserpens burtonensis]TXE20245.1 glycosyltransferase [Psychroserpens burtonensis]
MTIVHITGSLGGGGAEQMVLQLATNSKDADIPTIVIAVTDNNTLEPKFASNTIEYHFLNVTSYRNPSFKQGLQKLHNIIKESDDVVFHCHAYHSVLLGMVYSRFYKQTPIIFTLHSSTVESTIRRLTLFATKPFRKKDIIFTSNAKKWYLKNSAIIPNGVDFAGLYIDDSRTIDPDKSFSFLYLGRLSDEKNPLFMITAAKGLIQTGITKFVFDVVGDGNLKNQLLNAIKTEGLDKHFNILGFQNDIKSFLKTANCLILPSKWEGMPVAIIEASAAKLPIISTPVGSIPNFLNNTNAALSSLDTFQEAMVSCIQNYEEALRKSDILYNELKTKYDIKTVFKTHLELYQWVSK